MYYELTDRFQVAAGLEGTWGFFSDARNLSRITPSWLKLENAASNPPQIEADTVLDYTIRWMGIPIRWRTRIIEWSPPRQFIDLQVRGPYALWHHQHTFEPATDAAGGTLCVDRVIYRLRVPIVRSLVHPLVVRRQLLDIFRHRRRVISQSLGWIRAIQDDVQISRL